MGRRRNRLSNRLRLFDDEFKDWGQIVLRTNGPLVRGILLFRFYILYP